MNSKVDEYLRNSDQWQKELEALRVLVLEFGLTEELKWGVPCYTFKKSNILILHGFKNYCALNFINGALLKDTNNLLIQQTENVQAARQMRFVEISDIENKSTEIKAYIFEALEIEKLGLKIKKKQTSDFDIPEELVQTFEESAKFKSAFEKLTEGRKRGYLLHFSQPKQSKTRIARIVKNKERIYKGKGLNDCVCGLSKRMPNCDGSHKQLKKIICIVLLFGFSISVHAQIDARTKQKLDSIAKSNIEKGIPGIQVLVNDQKSKQLLSYGFQEIDQSMAINDSTNWRIGSITKLFTSVIILQLESEGKLKTSDPVSKYLDVSIPNSDKIQLKNLLNHTSGLFNYTDDKQLRKKRNKGVSMLQCVEYGLKHEADFNPNEQFKYCNTGFTILGLIIEKITQKSVKENFEERIFEPCGLKSAVYCEDGKVPSNTAHGYMQKGKRLKDYTDLDHGWANTAGAILSSVEDLNKFSNCLFQGNLLDSTQLVKMIAPSYKGKIPGANAMGIGFFLVLNSNETADYIFHGGNTLGYSCVFIYFPKKKLTIITAMNLFPEGKDNPVRFAEGHIIGTIVNAYSRR